uniref:Gnk2-homologous domain-containing protein n=1 Tax=Leersia perrieri TaxID=77586 RepID=A0A0D9W411_9ORYZ
MSLSSSFCYYTILLIIMEVGMIISDRAKPTIDVEPTIFTCPKTNFRLTPLSSMSGSLFQANMLSLLADIPSVPSPTGFASLSHGDGYDRAIRNHTRRLHNVPPYCGALHSAPLQRHLRGLHLVRPVHHQNDARKTYNPQWIDKIHNTTKIVHKFYSLMISLTTQAVNESWIFATGSAVYDTNPPSGITRTLYEMVQYGSGCCWGALGGTTYNYGCYMRYAVYPFLALRHRLQWIPSR